MNKWVALAVGGVLGTAARYALARWLPDLVGTGFPYGTLAANMSACLFIGFLESLASVRGTLGPEARLFLMTGFCGAYSTFSTWILETSALLADGEVLRAALNFFGSGALGLALLRLGMYLGSIA